MAPTRRNTWLWVAVQVVAVLALPAVTNYATNDRPDWLPSPTVVWVVALALAALVIVAAYRERADHAAGEPRERLAARIRRQWTAEAAALEINRPAPIEVTWSESGRPVAAPAAAVIGGLVGGRPKSLRLRGGVGDLVTAYRALPRRQLVVLGGPGAGKSVLAMQLTLGLLDSGELPVLLSLASWDPNREQLEAWLARRLAEEYPLARRASERRRIAGELVRDGGVVPVLDGLDELADALRPKALDALDAATGGRPLVLTCRGDEYEDAVRRSEGGPLSQAAVVEIEPVRAGDAEQFVTARGHDGETRWAPVFTELRADPSAPAAAALTSPLMLFLARTAYRGAASTPSELLDRGRFPETSDVEAHLIRGFLLRAYPSSRNAVAWLGFLARSVRDRDTGEIRWWTIGMVASRTQLSVVAVMAGWFGAVVTRVFSLLPGTRWWDLVVSYVIMAAFGLVLAGLAFTAAERSRRRTIQWGQVLRAAGRATLIGVGVAVGLTALGFLVYAWERFAPMGLRMAVECSELDAPQDCPVRQDFSLIDILSQLATLGLSTMVGFTVIAFGTALMRAEPDSDFADAPGPDRLLRTDRSVALTRALVVAVPAFGLVLGLHQSDLVLALAAAAWLTAMALLCSASTWLAIATVPLALAGRLPWRPMRFLRDAHVRGVLRQVGGVYEFRHKLLAEHLAGR